MGMTGLAEASVVEGEAAEAAEGEGEETTRVGERECNVVEMMEITIILEEVDIEVEAGVEAAESEERSEC